MVGEFH